MSEEYSLTPEGDVSEKYSLTPEDHVSEEYSLTPEDHVSEEYSLTPLGRVEETTVSRRNIPVTAQAVEEVNGLSAQLCTDTQKTARLRALSAQLTNTRG